MNYYLKINGKQKGPYTSEQVKSMVKKGKTPLNTLWAEIDLFSDQTGGTEKKLESAEWHTISSFEMMSNQPPITHQLDTSDSDEIKSPMAGYFIGATVTVAAILVFLFVTATPNTEENSEPPQAPITNNQKEGMLQAAAGNIFSTWLNEFTPPEPISFDQPENALPEEDRIPERPRTNNIDFAYSQSGGHLPPRGISGNANQAIDSNYQAGVKRAYICGTGPGRVKIISYGTEIPPLQQKYFADKGIFLVREFQRITGRAAPANFSYEIHFFKSQQDYIQFCSEQLGMTRAPDAFCQPTGNRLYSPIFAPSTGTSETVDVIAHEMIHAVAIAAYGDLPQCFDEGIADWLGYSYRHRRANVSNFYHQADLNFLAQGINSGGFPSMEIYLRCKSYEDWGNLLPSVGVGYKIGGMLLDFLWTHHRSFVLNGLNYCEGFQNNIPTRSMAFHSYVEKNWRGGWADLDKNFQAYILRLSKYNWQPDK